MKSLLLPLLLVIVILSCKKDPEPVITTGAEIVPAPLYNDSLLQGFDWQYSDLTYDSVSESFSGGEWSHKVLPDSVVIDGKDYFLVKLYEYPCNDDMDTVTTDYFLRKDQDENKVFWRDESDTAEIELYDFNLQVGSLVQNSITDIDMVIDSISSIDYLGVSYPEYFGTVVLPNGLTTRVGLSPLYLCNAGLLGLSGRNFLPPGYEKAHKRGGLIRKYGAVLAELDIDF